MHRGADVTMLGMLEPRLAPRSARTSPRCWLVLLGPEAAYIDGDGGAVGDAALSQSVALMDMGRKPYTEAGKERRRNRTTEALLPPHLLHGDDDCNQHLVHHNRCDNDQHHAACS